MPVIHKAIEMAFTNAPINIGYACNKQYSKGNINWEKPSSALNFFKEKVGNDITNEV